MEYSYSIKQEKSFKRELRNIYEYISYDLKEKRIAIKLINSITEKLKVLEYFPFANKIVLKEENFEYRKFIIKNYIIIYKVNLKEKEVKILHIYNRRENY